MSQILINQYLAQLDVLKKVGGTITGALVPSVRVNATAVAVIGAAVAPHGDSPHNAATMATGSGTVKAGGIAVCRAGDTATCGHAATGSANVRAG